MMSSSFFLSAIIPMIPPLYVGSWEGGYDRILRHEDYVITNVSNKTTYWCSVSSVRKMGRTAAVSSILDSVSATNIVGRIQ